MNRRLLLFAVTLALMVFPRQAMANAGTPLMWAGMFHLAIGNLLIGALEDGCSCGGFPPHVPKRLV